MSFSKAERHAQVDRWTALAIRWVDGEALTRDELEEILRLDLLLRPYLRGAPWKYRLGLWYVRRKMRQDLASR